MGFKLTSFAGVSLGQNLGRSDNTRKVRDATVRIPGGTLDTYGSTQQRPEVGQEITHSFILHDNSSAMDTNWKAINAKLGAKGSLVRTWADASTQFISARLMTLDAVKESAEYIAATATFKLMEDHWNGTFVGKALNTDWVLDDSVVLDSGYGAQAQTGFTSGSISLANAGNMAVTDAVITIKCGAGAGITKVGAQQNDPGGNRVIYWVWEWTGTAATTPFTAGREMVIACGPKRVVIGGAWHYKYFTLQAEHSRDEWITVAPGGNTIYINIVGDGVHEVKVGAYHHAWY